MASPPKPWCNVNPCGNNLTSLNRTGEHAAENPAFLQSSSSVYLPRSNGGPWGQQVAQAPPPIPPRPEPLSSSYRYGVGLRGYSPYTSYSNSMYPSLYRSYGGIGYGNRMLYGSNMYTATGDTENDLIRFAEESTRPAFQSIESVVHAVGSVSMMLESTFHALHSSYQAVLGVAQQFTRLRNHLTHILSTLAVLRSLHWLCLKILYYLGIRGRNPSNESAWSAASELANGSSVVRSTDDTTRSSWPIFVFLGVVLGAPWVILHLLSKAAEVKKKEVHLWASGSDKSGKTNVGIVVYDFLAQYPQEISVRAGQKIFIAPKHLQPKTKGWALVSADGKKVGLVPANYVKIACLSKSQPRTIGTSVSIRQGSNPQHSVSQNANAGEEPNTSSNVSTSKDDVTT